MPRHRKHRHDEASDDFSSLDAFDDFGAIPHRENDDKNDSIVGTDPFAPDYSDDHPFQTYGASGGAKLSGAGVYMGEGPAPRHVDSLAEAKKLHGTDADLPTLADAAAARSSGTRHTGALSDDFDRQLDHAFGEDGAEGFFSRGEDEETGAHADAASAIHSSIDDQNRQRHLRRGILVCIVVSVAIVVGVFVASLRARQDVRPVRDPMADLDDVSSISTSATPTTIPNLVDMFGKTTDEVLADLGPAASLATSDSDDTTQGVMINFASGAGDDVTASSAKLYLVEDSSGHVQEVSYSIDLDDLAYVNDSFSAAITDAGFVNSTLKAAGLTAPSVSLSAPDPSQYQTMDTSSSGVEYVETERYELSGATNLVNPTDWKITLTYDHSVSAETRNAKSLTRTMTIDLS